MMALVLKPEPPHYIVIEARQQRECWYCMLLIYEFMLHPRKSLGKFFFKTSIVFILIHLNSRMSRAYLYLT